MEKVKWTTSSSLVGTDSAVNSVKGEGMSEDDFWNLIADASERGKLSMQKLENCLERLPDEQIIEFDGHLIDRIDELDIDRCLKALQRNPEVEQSMSDDGLEYLLSGVISRGREVFEEARRDASVLESGQWFEHEDLLHVASELIEARDDSPQTATSRRGTVSSPARVISERYPVPPKDLEKEFPVDTFGWILADVQDASFPAIEELVYNDGSFAIYPEIDSDSVRSAFAGPADTACEKLRSAIDFREIPGLVLNISITVGDQSYGPEVKPICSRNGPFDLRPGVAIGIDRRSLPESESPELDILGASVVFDALEVYFAGHAQELAAISLLRGS